MLFFKILFIFGCSGSLLLRAAFSSCSKQELLSSCGARVSHCRGCSCGSWALELRLCRCGTPAHLSHGMWNLPRPGLKPVAPTLSGRFLTTDHSVQFSRSVVSDCNPMNCSTPGLPVYHQNHESTQTHVH